jgi:O-antigen/teichoic acid export membrane protein
VNASNDNVGDGSRAERTERTRRERRSARKERPRRTRSAWEPRNRAASASRRKKREERHHGPISRAINAWWDRLIRSITNREFGSAVELYDAGMTKRDYLWNSIGLGAWGAEFPILTILVTQLAGVEAAGRFSMAFVTAMMLMYIGNYGVRTFQVSDVNEEQSFAAYQICRVITCLVMIVVGWLWCVLHNYDSEMMMVCLGIFGFRAVDAAADVYEGRLQQQDKLYLAGISLTVRSVVTLVSCVVVLFVTRNLVLSSIAMLITALGSLLLYSIPVALLETDKSRSPALIEIREILVQCFPAAAALFLYAFIDNMPKFAMEGTLSYDNQLYYNAIYIPAHAIVMAVGFIYKPQLMKLATVWADPNGRRRFDLIILAMLAVIAGITAAMAALMGLVGIRLLSLMYGLDFSQFTDLVFAMVVAGGLAAAIDFLYQIITVLRQQASAMRLYAIGFVASVPLSFALVNFFGLSGAVYAALASMGVLLVLLAWRYIAIRRSAER